MRHNSNRNPETGRFETEPWTCLGPSRKLRKLYQELAALDAEMDAVRASNPAPEHAPSALVMIRARLRPLEARRWDLLRRIDLTQNRD